MSVDELKQEIAARLKAKRDAKAQQKPATQPRYDEVYFKGLEDLELS